MSMLRDSFFFTKPEFSCLVYVLLTNHTNQVWFWLVWVSKCAHMSSVHVRTTRTHSVSLFANLTPHLCHISQMPSDSPVSSKPPYEYQSHHPALCLRKDSLLSWSATGLSDHLHLHSISVCPTFSLWRMNTVWGSFLSSGSAAGNLLLCSHFPTITEAYKLP